MIRRDAGPFELALLRIAVFGIWFAILLDFDAESFSRLPPEMMDHHVLGAVVRLVASAPLLQVLKLAALAGSALCVLGVRPHSLAAGATALLILVMDVASKSIGSYANHAQTLVLLLALLLAFFPASDALSVHRKPPPERSPWMYRLPLMAVATLVAATYAFIGARRLFVGAVSIYTDGSIVRWVVARTLEEGAHDISVGLKVLDHPWLEVPLAVGTLVTTIVEILSPVALVNQRFRWVWLAVIAGFHVSTLFLMNIFFWENLILLAVLFTPLPALLHAQWTGPQPAATSP